MQMIVAVVDEVIEAELWRVLVNDGFVRFVRRDHFRVCEW